MALMKVSFYSQALMKTTNFNIVIPNDLLPIMIQDNEHYKRQTKALYLLHGFSGNENDWLYGSLIQNIAVQYNIAVIMPAGDNSFYVNANGTGKNYGDYVSHELVEYTRKVFNLSDKKEDTFIGGLSMGAFGAIRNGLNNTDTFGKIFGLSSALIINDIKNKKEGFKNEVADYDYYVSIFGDLSELDESDKNPEYLIKQLKTEGKDIPPIFMACGTEDFLLNQNRQFNEFLVKEGINVDYRESKGIHDWNFWNEYLEKAVKWLLDAE